MWTHEVKLEKYQATTPSGGPLQLGTAESQGNEFLHIKSSCTSKSGKAGKGWPSRWCFGPARYPGW